MFDLDSLTSLFAGSLDLLLGQDGAAAPPGDLAPVGPADGSGGAAAPSPFGGQFMYLVLGLVLLMLVFSILGPRRERKRREAMLSQIKKHDRVQTVGGVIGAIVEVKPDVVVLKVDESSNTRITFARSAIQQVLSSRDEGAKSENEPER